MQNEYLKPALDAEICHEIQNARNYTPRYVVLSRVVETVCNYINLPLNCLPDYKNTIRLDSDLKRSIEEYWQLQSLCNNNNNNGVGNNEPRDELEKILSKDFHKPMDLVRFVNLLMKRESKQFHSTEKKLFEILAMDGYLGDDAKRYVEHLKLATWDPVKSIHVNAVRQMYRDNVIEKPQDMHAILEMAFGKRNPETSTEIEAKNLYQNLVRDALDSIREWKMSQEEESKRKENGTVGKKRKHSEIQSESQRQVDNNVVNGSDNNKPKSKKRGRKSQTPLKIEIPPVVEVEKNENLSSSSTSSSEE